MTNIMNLPLDVWLVIVEHISLKTLASLYDTFFEFGNMSSIIKRQAIKVIASLLATGTPTVTPSFANNGACYKFGVKHPRAGRYWHQKDHGGILPCGGHYTPHFPLTMKYSRSFHRINVDDTKTEMVVLTNSRKMFEQNHITIPIRSNDGGPMEILQVIVAFSPDSAQLANEDGLLHLVYNTLSENIEAVH